MTWDDLIRYALIGSALLLALVLRLRRMGRAQRLRPGRLWVVPVIFSLLAIAILRQFPPQGADWLWIGAGLVAGAMVGWQRGRLVDVGIDGETGHLTQRSSPATLVFLVLLVMLRWVLHWLVELGDARWHLGAMLVSNIFVAFAVGALSFYRIELWLRARALSRG